MPDSNTPAPVDPIEAASRAFTLAGIRDDHADLDDKLRAAIAAWLAAQPSDYAELKANLTDWSSGLITSGRSLCKDALDAITTLEARVAGLQAQLATAETNYETVLELVAQKHAKIVRLTQAYEELAEHERDYHDVSAAELATARAQERERCAKECDTIQAEWSGRVTTALEQGRLGQDDATHYFSIRHGARQCARAIRVLEDEQ